MDPIHPSTHPVSGFTPSQFAEVFAQSSQDDSSSGQLVTVLRLARRDLPGKTIEDAVVVRRLVRAMLGAGLVEKTGGNIGQLETAIAETLMEDPGAMRRLRAIWERSAESVR